MSTLILHITPEKQDWFLSLLKEFNFVSDISVFENDLQLTQDELIELSEKDISSGALTSQKDLEKEVSQWKKK